MRFRKALIARKSQFFPEKDELERGKAIADTFYCLASNKPGNFGVYTHYHNDEVNELIAHYEDELKEDIMNLDGEHLCRFA